MFFYAADTVRAARVRGHCLSHRDDMLLFVADLVKKHDTWTMDTELGFWYGLKVVNETVNCINWPSSSWSGSLRWGVLPPTTQEVNLWCNTFCCIVSWDDLPLELRVLNLGDNKFSGKVDLTCLPNKLEILR